MLEDEGTSCGRNSCLVQNGKRHLHTVEWINYRISRRLACSRIRTCNFPVLNRSTTVFSLTNLLHNPSLKTEKVPEESFLTMMQQGKANPFNDPRPWTLIWICKSTTHSDAKYGIEEKNSHAKSLLPTMLGDPFCRMMNLSHPLNCPFLLRLQIQKAISCMWFA